MGISNNEINYESLIKHLGNCCLTEEACGSCKKEKCLIGYSRSSIASCLNHKVTYVIDGYKNLPSADTKLYSNNELIEGIADILHQCRSCSENHFDNCIINILRSSYEILIFGEPIEYKGSSLLYFVDAKSKNKELAEKIYSVYNSIK